LGPEQINSLLIVLLALFAYFFSMVTMTRQRMRRDSWRARSCCPSVSSTSTRWRQRCGRSESRPGTLTSAAWPGNSPSHFILLCQYSVVSSCFISVVIVKRGLSVGPVPWSFCHFVRLTCLCLWFHRTLFPINALWKAFILGIDVDVHLYESRIRFLPESKSMNQCYQYSFLTLLYCSNNLKIVINYENLNMFCTKFKIKKKDE